MSSRGRAPRMSSNELTRMSPQERAHENKMTRESAHEDELPRMNARGRAHDELRRTSAGRRLTTGSMDDRTLVERERRKGGTSWRTGFLFDRSPIIGVCRATRAPRVYGPHSVKRTVSPTQKMRTSSQARADDCQTRTGSRKMTLREMDGRQQGAERAHAIARVVAHEPGRDERIEREEDRRQ
jgi:hypothetical protein